MKDFIKTMEMWENVTRFEVIDKEGRVYVNSNILHLGFSLQDEGRTLKVFIKEFDPDSD